MGTYPPKIFFSGVLSPYLNSVYCFKRLHVGKGIVNKCLSPFSQTENTHVDSTQEETELYQKPQTEASLPLISNGDYQFLKT